jgi:hypothetical protein
MTRTRKTFFRNCGEGAEEPAATAMSSSGDRLLSVVMVTRHEIGMKDK